MSDEKAKKLFEKGTNFYKEKKLDLAQNSFEEALKYSPKRSSILKNLALIYFLNKNYKKSNEVLIKLENQNIDDKDLNDLKFKVLKNLNKVNELKLFLDNKTTFTKSNNLSLGVATFLTPSDAANLKASSKKHPLLFRVTF